MKIFAALTIVLLTQMSCASVREAASIKPRSFEENGVLMSEPTPSAWAIGSTWNFVQYAEDGTVALDVTFRVTDRPVRTCNSGDWRALEITKGHVGNGTVPLQHAYNVSGRLLTLDLTGACDLGYLQGALDQEKFDGQTVGGGFFDGDFHPQRVIGHRSR